MKTVLTLLPFILRLGDAGFCPPGPGWPNSIAAAFSTPLYFESPAQSTRTQALKISGATRRSAYERAEIGGIVPYRDHSLLKKAGVRLIKIIFERHEEKNQNTRQAPYFENHKSNTEQCKSISAFS